MDVLETSSHFRNAMKQALSIRRAASYLAPTVRRPPIRSLGMGSSGNLGLKPAGSLISVQVMPEAKYIDYRARRLIISESEQARSSMTWQEATNYTRTSNAFNSHDGQIFLNPNVAVVNKLEIVLLEDSSSGWERRRLYPYFYEWLR